MYHTIDFAVEFMADLETSCWDRLEQVLIAKGTRLQARIKPYVVETREGPVEVADLFFQDGTTARRVPCAYFCFSE
jgi:hypothetical protein